VPLVPLDPRTRYAFIMTNGIGNTFGVPAGADTVFAAVRDAHLAGLASVPGVPELDPLFPAITPLIDAAQGLLGIPGGSIVSAWSMQTQSIGDVLEVIEQTATARTALLAPAGITTADLGLGLPGIADIYMGYIQVPYFGDPANPLDSFWINASLMPPNVADPAAVPRVAEQRIPLLATLPNAASGQTEPANGWPVAIFQHGITSNRTALFAIADAFADAGFAVIAIDLPLHGVSDTASPLYQGPGTPFGDNERHFNLDNVGDTGIFAPDGEIDNGWQILNLQNPLNARDHIRQAVADMIHLTRTIPALNFPDGDPDADLDGARIHFVGMSLGSIISGVFLGLDTDVRTATLASPAGPWTSILTDPEAVDFGAPIRAGLAAQGLPQGTAGFDNFVRDLQTLIDPVDPVNYAAAASTSHPLHVLEVLGDVTVPNAPTEYIAALWNLDGVSTTAAATPPDTVSGIVRFTAGGHSSLLNPAIDPAVTQEMQIQTVTFAASDGSVIAITDESLVE
jgi:pimeloyl-ACP methyl ester carboxylesterase